MSTYRKPVLAISGRPAVDGAGVNLIRVFGHDHVKQFDPFLMLDAFDSSNPDEYMNGFPAHPHRGMETFTYLLHGEMSHQDSLGNKGNIKSGGGQWMTAGSGIIHQEMPKRSPRLAGLQLWINLPAANKMASPKYRDINEAAIPVIKEEGTEVRVLAGEYNGRSGATRGDYVDVNFLDVWLRPDGSWTLPVEPGRTLFGYIIEGDCRFEGSDRDYTARQAVLFSDGDAIEVDAGEAGTRLILVSGKPLHEKVSWGGPVVMNSERELQEAWNEISEGTFIKTR